MHLVLTVLLAFHSATVILLQENSETIVALQTGDTLYTAEFSTIDLKPDTFKDGDHVRAEVKDGKLIAKLKNGRRVSARVHWVQRVLIHPLARYAQGDRKLPTKFNDLPWGVSECRDIELQP